MLLLVLVCARQDAARVVLLDVLALARVAVEVDARAVVPAVVPAAALEMDVPVLVEQAVLIAVMMMAALVAVVAVVMLDAL